MYVLQSTVKMRESKRQMMHLDKFGCINKVRNKTFVFTYVPLKSKRKTLLSRKAFGVVYVRMGGLLQPNVRSSAEIFFGNLTLVLF